MDNTDSFGEKIGDFIEDLTDSLMGNERQASLTQFAQRNKFEFQKRLSYSTMDYELKALNLFKSKSRRRIRNTLQIKGNKIRNVLQKQSKSLQAKIHLFDFKAQHDFRKNNTTVLLIESELLKLPEFIIRPKKTTEKLGRLFSSKDPNAARYPAFNKAFTLLGIEEDYLSYFVTQKLTDLMLKEPNMTVEGLKKYLVLYEKNKIISTEDLLSFYDFGLELTYILLFDNSNEFV
jgi:hypothetical protein